MGLKILNNRGRLNSSSDTSGSSPELEKKSKKFSLFRAPLVPVQKTAIVPATPTAECANFPPTSTPCLKAAPPFQLSQTFLSPVSKEIADDAGFKTANLEKIAVVREETFDNLFTSKACFDASSKLVLNRREKPLQQRNNEADVERTRHYGGKVGRNHIFSEEIEEEEIVFHSPSKQRPVRSAQKVPTRETASKVDGLKLESVRKKVFANESRDSEGSTSVKDHTTRKKDVSERSFQSPKKSASKGRSKVQLSPEEQELPRKSSTRNSLSRTKIPEALVVHEVLSSAEETQDNGSSRTEPAQNKDSSASIQRRIQDSRKSKGNPEDTSRVGDSRVDSTKHTSVVEDQSTPRQKGERVIGEELLSPVLSKVSESMKSKRQSVLARRSTVPTHKKQNMGEVKGIDSVHQNCEVPKDAATDEVLRTRQSLAEQVGNTGYAVLEAVGLTKSPGKGNRDARKETNYADDSSSRNGVAENLETIQVDVGPISSDSKSTGTFKPARQDRARSLLRASSDRTILSQGKVHVTVVTDSDSDESVHGAPRRNRSDSKQKRTQGSGKRKRTSAGGPDDMKNKDGIERGAEDAGGSASDMEGSNGAKVEAKSTAAKVAVDRKRKSTSVGTPVGTKNKDKREDGVEGGAEDAAGTEGTKAAKVAVDRKSSSVGRPVGTKNKDRREDDVEGSAEDAAGTVGTKAAKSTKGKVVLDRKKSAKRPMKRTLLGSNTISARPKRERRCPGQYWVGVPDLTILASKTEGAVNLEGMLTSPTLNAAPAGSQDDNKPTKKRRHFRKTGCEPSRMVNSENRHEKPSAWPKKRRLLAKTTLREANTLSRPSLGVEDCASEDMHNGKHSQVLICHADHVTLRNKNSGLSTENPKVRIGSTVFWKSLSGSLLEVDPGGICGPQIDIFKHKVFVVVEGSVVVEITGEQNENELSASDVAVLPAGSKFTIRNKGPSKAIINVLNFLDTI